MNEDRSNAVLILVAAGLVAVLLGALALLRRPGTAQPRASLTNEERAYLGQILVTDAKMSAAQNFLGDTITYLDARVINRGSKRIRQLELQVEFVDLFNQVVLRETARPVAAGTPPLEPGKSRTFHMSFDHMPADWNQAPPRMKATSVRF